MSDVIGGARPNLPTLVEQRQFWDRRWTGQQMPKEFQLRRGSTVMQLLRGLPLARPKILDLGCGTGWFTQQLAELGDVTGLDLSEAAIALARSQFPNVSFLCANLYEAALHPASFDVIVAQEVIAHVEDQVAFVRRMAELLKPRGYLVVTTANKVVMERVDWPTQPREHIEQWLTMKRFKALLRPRFQVLRSTSIMPAGNRGFLRLVNSVKLNTALEWMVSRRYVDRLKERAGLGYTLVILAQKAD
jgi:2-polyprenyl-3-methyl-5-hydroxy-6-metoxy-1,4-benzoquinol methylase